MLYTGGVAFISLMGLFMAGVFMEAESGGGLGPVMTVLLLAPFSCIVILLVLFMKKRGNAIKSGMPLKDEMVINAEGRAGRYASMLMIYFLLGLMWYHGFGPEFGLPELAARHVIYLLLFAMMGLFFGLRWYFIRKGDS